MKFALAFLAALLAPALAHNSKRALKGSATVYQTCVKPKQWAVTLDDGPYLWQQNITAQIKAAGGLGTFFVNGNNWACIYDSPYPEFLQATYKAGHQIGHHTWSHPDIATLSPANLTAEVTQLEVALKKILGIKPALFRPPFGSYNAQNLKTLASLGYKTVVDWDVDSGDADGNTPAQSNAIFNKAVNTFPKQHISLDHETHQTTVTMVLPNLLSKLKAKGYKLVTVAECLGLPAYASETHKMGKRDSTWHC